MAAVNVFETKPRRWPVAVAAVALASLFLLTLFVPTKERRQARDDQELLFAEKHVDAGEYERADRLLRAFIDQRPESPRLPKAKFLRAIAILGKAEQGTFPGKTEIDVAWKLLSEAAANATGELATLVEDIFTARLHCPVVLAREDLYVDAIRYLRELEDSIRVRTRLGRIQLTLAGVYSDYAYRNAALRKHLLENAMKRIDAFRDLRKGDVERVPGDIAMARLLWQEGKYSEMYDVVNAALAEFPNSLQDSELRFERGRALSRLDRPEEAIRELTEVAESLKDYRKRDLALLHLVYLQCERSDPDCQPRAENLIRSASTYRPAALLFLGTYFLRTGRARPYEQLLLGLKELSSPLFLQMERFDLNGIYSDIRRAWKQEPDGEKLQRLAEIIEEFHRLHPDDHRYAFDVGMVYRLAADHFHRRVKERKGVGDQQAAADFRKTAANFYYRSGETFARIARGRAVKPEDISASYRNAADAYYEGGWYAKAADQYYRFYLYHPEMNHDGLYWEGVSFSRAGLHQSKSGRERAAVGALSEYIRVAPTGSILVPRSLLERGRIYLMLGEFTSAATDFERVTTQPGLGISPDSLEWSEGKRLRGRAELLRSLELKPATMDANVKSQFLNALRSAQLELTEYIERYVRDGDTKPRGLQAVFDLARVHVAEEKWALAAEQLEKVISLAPRVREALDHEADEAVRNAHFLLGETYAALGRDEDAYRAFEMAYNRYVARPERLWGLIGQARAAVRTNRLEVARRLQGRARDLFEKNRETYESSLAGFGRTYWTDYMGRLDRELKRAEAAGGGS